MKILFIVPEIRMDSGPAHFPFWAAILAAIRPIYVMFMKK